MSGVLTSREQKAKYQDMSISLQQNQTVSITNKRKARKILKYTEMLDRKETKEHSANRQAPDTQWI